MTAPKDEYQRRKREREAAAAALERKHIRLGNAKVAIFIAAAIYGVYALSGAPSTAAFAIGAVVFVALSVWHELVMRALTRARAAVAYYEQGIARIEDRWMRDEPSGERFRDRDHPYADDLDVFGPRSLFQLISGCRTPMGEERLASWLKSASEIAAIRDRQARVAGLGPHVELRERIAVANAGRRKSIHAARLMAWAEQQRASLLPPVRFVIVSLAAAFVAALVLYMNGGPGMPLAIAAVMNTIALAWLGKRADAIVESLASATESAALDLVANVVREIERESFTQPALSMLARRLKGDSSTAAASRGLARLARVSDWADSRHNVFLRLAEIPVLFTLQLAYAADAWRRRHGSQLRDWIDAIAEIEALLSLAGYSYEHPADPFPEIVEGNAPVFEATEAAHPLIAAATAVRNAVGLAAPIPAPRSLIPAPRSPIPDPRSPIPDPRSPIPDPRSPIPDPRSPIPPVLIVSGSNMSGKSTLLRTVGTNALLALAGAPVRAERLRLTPLAIGTCLRHTDSLQEHRSGFYTEALRIRLIADLLDRPLPVLFLFDELLSGTNSKDRRIAAEGVIRTMLGRGAIGMVTTHDLALTEIAAIFPGDVRNVHLEDKAENGKMVFDYKLREGVITHSNALELMRIIGLDV